MLRGVRAVLDAGAAPWIEIEAVSPEAVPTLHAAVLHAEAAPVLDVAAACPFPPHLYTTHIYVSVAVAVAVCVCV